MLAQGGSATDAAIATQLALNVVEPQSSGIGGGAFMFALMRLNATPLAYDGRETAPAAATPDQFLAPDGKPRPFLQAVDGGLSVGTPGVLRMLELAHRAHGKLPWATLFAPAIALAEEGFAVSPRLSTSIAGSAARIRAQGGAVAAYFFEGRRQPAGCTGTWLRSPALAAGLRHCRWRGQYLLQRRLGPRHGAGGGPPPHAARSSDADRLERLPGPGA